MGCFSYLCSDCDHAICSDSSSGEHCILLLVEDGKVLEWMQGQYNSYGCVFSADGSSTFEWTVKEWGDIVDMTYSACSEEGIAAYHSGCFNGDMEHVIPSESDPEQGWGKYRFPTTGPNNGHGHGVRVRIQPKWTKAQ